MKFHGFEKLSLVDYDEHVAATVFTGGCNMLCPFCHNGGLVITSERATVTEEEVLSFLSKRVGLLDGLSITGGEPTLHKDLPEFCKKVKDLGFDVKLDSNGTNPEMLNKLIEQNAVDYFAMDIKNSPQKYSLTVGKNIDLVPIKESVKLLMEKAKSYEFRTTLVSEFHTEEDIEEIGKWIKGAKKYVLQHFYDRDTCIEKGFTEVKKEQAKKYLEIAKRYIDNVKLRSY